LRLALMPPPRLCGGGYRGTVERFVAEFKT
jgi:hypothetical protein